MADENIHAALNDVIDAIERLRDALNDREIEDALDALDALTEALNQLRAIIGPSIPRHGPETA